MTKQAKKKGRRQPAEPHGLNMLAGMAARVEAERLEQEEQDAEYERYCYRWLARFEKWAIQQSKEELAEHYSLTLLMLIETRKTRRMMEETRRIIEESSDRASLMADAWRGVADRSIRREQLQKDARRKGAITKLANDPKQHAKAGALELWKERNDGQHPKLRTVEKYATEVMRRWPVLTSAKVICSWSARWAKDVKQGRTPAC